MDHDVIYLDVAPAELEAAPGKGCLPADRVIVGIAPSPVRPAERKNEPFGSKSYELITRLGKSFPSLYVTNFRKTPLGIGNKIPKREQQRWAPLLYHELKLACTPGVTRVLALGTEPAKLLCPGFYNLREDHGTVFFNPELGVEVIPTYHFAAAMRDPEKQPLLSRDLQRFFEGEFTAAQQYVERLPRIMAEDTVYLDIETSGLNLETDVITSVGILSERRNAPVFILKSPSTRDLQQLFYLLKGHTIIGHNLAFDLGFLEKHSNLPWTRARVKDTMLAAYVLGEQVLSLKHLTTTYTNRRGSRSMGGFEDSGYLAEDVASTREVASHFLKRASSQWISGLLWRLSPRIARMRLYGVHVDWTVADKLLKKYAKEIAQSKTRLLEYGEINWNSTIQVADLLLQQGVPLETKTNAGRFAVNEEALAPLRQNYPVVDEYFRHKDLLHEASWITSYKELAWKDGRLHPKFNLTGAATGRSSMTDPNLQQVPRVGPIKLLFISRFKKGYFGLVDLSQAELRVAALLSNDELMAEALLSSDVHRYIASLVYEKPQEEITAFQRKRSKGITFGLLYGGGAAGLAKRIGVPVAEVEKVVRVFYSRFPKLAAYIQEQKRQAVTLGQSTTPLGRIRDLRMLAAVEGDSSAERKGINSPIQGTASDIMLIILDHVFTEVFNQHLESSPIFGVHDSSAYDVHPAERDAMVQAVRNGFLSLNETPLAKLPLWKDLPIVGEFLLGHSWANVESTNEANYKPAHKYPCSSQGDTE